MAHSNGSVRLMMVKKLEVKKMSGIESRIDSKEVRLVCQDEMLSGYGDRIAPAMIGLFIQGQLVVKAVAGKDSYWPQGAGRSIQYVTFGWPEDYEQKWFHTL